MARKEWAQGCKAWLNGTLIGDALDVNMKIGEAGQRMNTIGGNTGTTVADPTHFTASIKHAVAKAGLDIRKIRRLRTSKAEVTLKVQIGPETFTAVGKILTCNPSGSPGKAEFDFDFDGDEQEV
jgi:hypothetical protein